MTSFQDHNKGCFGPYSLLGALLFSQQSGYQKGKGSGAYRVLRAGSSMTIQPGKPYTLYYLSCLKAKLKGKEAQYKMLDAVGFDSTRFCCWLVRLLDNSSLLCHFLGLLPFPELTMTLDVCPFFSFSDFVYFSFRSRSFFFLLSRTLSSSLWLLSKFCHWMPTPLSSELLPARYSLAYQ